MKFLFLFMISLAGSSAFAQPEQATEKPMVVTPAEPAVAIEPIQGPTMLHPFGVHGTLSLGYLAPFKYGVGVTHAKTPTWVWDLSYLKGGVGFGVAGLDFGGFDESLVMASGRYYPWSGSFNWIIGLSRHAYRVYLGNEIVSRMTGASGSTDILRVETLGLQLGVGNRFRFRNQLWLAIDWLTFNFPLTTLRAEGPAYDAFTNANDRRLVGDALSLMEKLPTATFLRTSLGWSF